MQSLETLQAEFTRDGARFEEGPGGLPVLVIETEACTARVFPSGGHVVHWAPAGQPPVLFLSDRSAFAPGKAIRGGIPVCFPWFGARRDDPRPDGKPSPAHGFARTRAWTVEDVHIEDNGSVGVELTLAADEATRALWDAPFHATLFASFGPTLEVKLEVRNDGDADLDYEAALHTYLTVGDVGRIRLRGLERTAFIDKVDGAREKDGASGPLVLEGETDRVFQRTRASVIVEDPDLHRHLHVDKGGSLSTVVWNPWLVKAQTMPDVGGEAWRQFVCVEAANVHPHAVSLPPNAVHQVSTRIRVVPQRG